MRVPEIQLRDEERHKSTLSLLHPDRMINHYLNVARILQKHHADDTTILAAIYHGFPHADKRRSFGEAYQTLANRARLPPQSLRLIRQYNEIPMITPTAGFHPDVVSKLYGQAAIDPRIFLIAAADRLDQLQNPKMDEGVRKFIARSVFSIYAPDAHRANLNTLARVLEDEALKTLYPRAFSKVETNIRRRLKNVTPVTVNELQTALSGIGFKATIQEDEKGRFSTLRKVLKNAADLFKRNLDKVDPRTIEKEIAKMIDLKRFRIITPDGVAEDGRPFYDVAREAIENFYGNRIELREDNINSPRANGYQTYQFEVRGTNPKHASVEIQLRSQSMHENAEFGNAAHWGFKGHETSGLFTHLARYYSTRSDMGRIGQIDFERFLSDELAARTEHTLIHSKGGVYQFTKQATPIDVVARLHPEQLPYLSRVEIGGRSIKLDKPMPSSADSRFIFDKIRVQMTPGWVGYAKTPRGLEIVTEHAKRLGILPPKKP